MKILSTGFVAFFLFVSGLQAQILLSPDTAHIYMRDGKWLAADLHLPDTSSPKPTILIQTPYNRTLYRFGLPLGFGTDLSSSPYNWVIVDWRGFYGSLSAFVASPDRGNDGYDVVEWIAAQSWSDGQVGTWGPSALGNVQFQTAEKAPPALKCICPLVAAPTVEYSVYYQNGCLKEEYVDQLDALGFGVGSLVRANPVENVIWDFARAGSFKPDSVMVPALLIGGWFDHNISKMLEYFEPMVTTSPVAVRDQHKMLIGPWVHGGSGTAYVGSEDQGELSFPDAAGASDAFARSWFNHYLRGMSMPASYGRYNYYPGGIGGFFVSNDVQMPFSLSYANFYLSSDPFALDSGYELSRDIIPPSGISDLDLNYDPKDPSPTIGGPTLSADLSQGPYDQESVESRDDVLIFTSEMLVDSTSAYYYFGEAFRIHGSVKVQFNVKTDRLDTDFAIRLTDVFPDGRSIIIRDDIFRMRFRDGFRATDTSMVDTSQTYLVDYELDPIIYDLAAGHRLRLIISGSNSPRFDRNLNNGGPLLTAGDSLVAHSKIFVNDSSARISVPFQIIASREDDIENESLALLYPNPVSATLNVNLMDVSKRVEVIDIFDLNGRKVLRQEGVSEVNVEDLEKGMYLIRIELSSGERVLGRFLKE